MKSEENEQSKKVVTSTADMIVYIKHSAKDQGWKKPKKTTQHLFKDEYMRLFLSKTGKEMFSQSFNASQEFAILPAIRHKYMSQTLSRHAKKYANSTTQVIILGSGFDTRPVRKRKYVNIRFFEVDMPEMLDKKAAIYKANNIDPNAVYIRMNYVTEDLIEGLKRADVQFDMPTHFIWEGNLVYLQNETRDQIMRILKSHFTNATLSFDYIYLPVIEAKKSEYQFHDQFKEEMAKKGIQLVGGIADIKTFVNAHKVTLIENYSVFELLQKYRPNEKLNTFFHEVSLCTLKL